MPQRDKEYKRLELLFKMLVHYLDQAYSDSELGKELDTDRSNVWRIRGIMADELEIPVQESAEQPGKYFIRKDFQMRYIHFSPSEMASLYLAGRRLQQQTKTSQEHVALALKKLANAMHKPFAESLVKAAQTVTSQEQDARQEEIFATLVECWLEQVPVRITHRKLHGQPRTYYVEPYQIEPSVWGDGNYLIGKSDYHKGLATFKLARIEKAVKSTRQYTIPPDFDIHDLLKHAWGVWHADEEPVLIKLHFNRYVTPRVRETLWHPQQTIVVHEDSSCTWQVRVAEWKEMESWVRGWGSSVKVEEPIALRTAIENEIRRLVKLYQVAELPPVPSYQLLWAKTSQDKQRTHPLICHLIDVGQAALALWKFAFPDSLRRHMARLMNMENDLDAAGRTLAFWIALHDLGKASPAFQRLHKPAIEVLEAAKLSFPPPIGKQKVWHATITAVTLDSLLSPALPPRTRKKIAQALGGHHGSWPSAQLLGDYRDVERMVGNQDWQAIRAELVNVLQTCFQPSDLCSLNQDQAEFNSFLTLFSGMTTVADWIGSMEEYFNYMDVLPVDVKKYVEQAATQAEIALKELHWTAWQPPQQTASFQELFPYLTNGPSPMQQAVIRLAERLTEPALVIVEAPTGSGKTEAALYLADFWAQHLQQRGLYVAMPTMATSNQMFSRVTEFLEQRYPDQAVTPLLIHSQARWMQEEPPPEINTEEESGNPDDSDSEAQDMAWFLPKKRSLLAPCGVGTVDQTLLSVLQTRHFFVRLLGLYHKTIIFDEIHAYDVYMSELFQKLLQWLRAMNVSVVLLSATLPANKRLALLTAYAGPNSVPPVDVAYPAITWAMNGNSGVVPLPKPENRTIRLEWIDRSPEAIVEKLRIALSAGGCAAVICNTVARAQKIYDAIWAAGVVDCKDLTLFHARTRFGWRQQTEKEVLKRFGPGRDKTIRNPERPEKAIVVATQVIEQSLDLDFDLLISDLAPIDLLIQRAGRLQRHPQNQAERKTKLKTPTLIVAASDTGEDLPDMDDDGHIYEPELLIRTYLLIQKRNELALPGETSDLIKQVYSALDLSGLATPAITAALAKAQQTKTEHEAKAKFAAEGKLILDVTDERLLVQTNHDLDEENPEVYAAYQAMTRLGPRTLSVVCLHEDETGQLYTEPDQGGELVHLSQKPDAALTQALALSTLSISHQGIVNHLLWATEAKPKAWAKHALLRHHYVVRFRKGAVTLPGTPYRLTLHEKTGLTIEKL